MKTLKLVKLKKKSSGNLENDLSVDPLLFSSTCRMNITQVQNLKLKPN